VLVGARQVEEPTQLASAGIEELVIDLPPGMPPVVPKLIARADLVLVPVKATPDDLLAVPPALDALAKHPRWAFVLMQTPPRSRLVDGSLRHLAGLGRVAPINLGGRQDFPAAAIEGRAAVEFPGTRSAEEVKQLRIYVDSLLGNSHGQTAT
jgi:chromosome partitioning protein